MDPLTLTAGATALAGALDFGGSLISGHSSRSESHKNRVESRRQFNVQDDYNKNFVNYRVQDAIRAGVNPLTALGASGGHYSPTISAGGSGGSSGVGEGMSRLGDRFMQFAQVYQKRAMKDNDEMSKLDLESKRLQNQILQARLDEMLNPGNPQDVEDPVSLALIAGHPESYSLRDLGKKNPYPPLLKKWRLPDGRVVRMIDSDAIPDTDVTNTEGLRATSYAAPFIAGTYKSASERKKIKEARDYYSWYNVTKRYFRR